MDYIATDIDTWMPNTATNRAHIATEEIIALNTAHCNQNGITIAVGIDAQVQQHYDLGVVRTATQVDPATE